MAMCRNWRHSRAPKIYLVFILAFWITGCALSFAPPVHLIRKQMWHVSTTSSVRTAYYPIQAAPAPRDEALPPNRATNFFAFLATYVALPFSTSVILNVENENYQFAKQRFDAAMASGFDPQITAPNSPEYIAMSNLYNDSMKSLFVLLLSKRLALYFIATVATVYAGWRSYEGVNAIRCGTFSGPGESLDRLNSEILDREPYFIGATGDSIQEDAKDDGEDKTIFASLIDSDEQTSSEAGKTLAIGLPLALTTSLAVSYGFVVAGQANFAPSVASENVFLSDVQSWLSSNFPYLTALPGSILSILFLSAEFRRVLPSMNSSRDDSTSTKEPLLCPGNILAMLYVMGAYLAKLYPTISFGEQAAIPISFDLWPFQNGINIALTATVTRAIGPFLVSSTSKSIRTTALALTGVAIFDGVSVFGTIANAAMDTGSQSSVMEVVAKSKLVPQTSNTAAPWQPGLLEIIVGHNNNQVTEALGLGDVVFPACLIVWALNADIVDSSTASESDENRNSLLNKYQYTFAATFGYVIASLIMEVIGSFSLLGNRGGLPALVFLIPSILLCVTATAWRKDDLQEVWGDS